MAHNMKVKDADGVNRRVVSIDTDVGGTGDEVHLQVSGVVTASYRVLGVELLSVGTGATVALGSSLGIPTGSRSALISVEGADIRFREDGGALVSVPTTNANAGHKVTADNVFEVAPMDAAGVPTLSSVVLRGISATATVIVSYRAPRIAD